MEIQVKFKERQENRHRVQSFYQLREIAEQLDEGKADYTIPLSQLNYAAHEDHLTLSADNVTNDYRGGLVSGLFAKVGGVQPTPMTESAFGDLCGRLGDRPSAAYLATCPAELVVPHMEHWTDQEFLFPTSSNWERYTHKSRFGEPAVFTRMYNGTVRYVGSQVYSPINNGEIVTGVADYLARSPETMANYDLTRSYISPDDLDFMVVFVDQTGTFNRIGFAVRNNEVGQGFLRMHGLVYTTTCNNSLRIYEGGIKIRHNWVDPQDAINMLLMGVQNVIKSAGMAAARLVNAEEIPVLNAVALVEQLGDAFKIGSDLIPNLRQDVANGGNTFASVVNALTHQAQNADPDVQEEVEVMAGRLLMRPSDFVRSNNDGEWSVRRRNRRWSQDNDGKVYDL